MTIRPPLFAEKNLNALRVRAEAGEDWALVYAMQVCLGDGVAVPDWLAGAWLHRLTAASELAVRSWDEVMPPIQPKGRKLTAMRLEREWAEFVAFAVYIAVKRGAAIGDDLFEALAARERWPFSGKTASNIYYAGRTAAQAKLNPTLRAIFDGIEHARKSARARPIASSPKKRRKTSSAR